MVVRVKSQWHKEDSDRSVDETAGAIAFNGWRLSMEKASDLHGEQFIYDNDKQRMGVITEYLIYLIQIVDRMAHEMIDDELRRDLITKLALRFADHVQDNSTDLFGPGDYTTPFIERLNHQSAEYGELGFSGDGPSYPFLRHLGASIQQVMGDDQVNRWVIDQVMDKDGMDIYKTLRRVVRNLLM
jgi:hypothetical protein